ncbi:cupin domain-containing protein [Lactobacillus xujianguonis]|uniref:cupin domain-containing protein n=1 Tax=Lactobacillus xujianguonis TaxID=2495899 RepID=UPI000FD8D406|nr:cupin domain-containing protein [Lactobacillus xujianguonis]RVU72291.1 cupin domain-containing protein [Lactobacillus xujianguonis]
MKQALLKELLKLNAAEMKQLQNQHFESDFDEKSLLNTQQYSIPVFTADFFKNHDLYISKHNRFADYPQHTHTFLEMNYIVKGQATEIVDGEELILHEGDILILDVGTTHAIQALGRNDLLLNIIFKNQINFSFDNLRNLGENQNIQSEFLLANSQYSHYLIYRAKHTEDHVQTMADQIIEEYFNPGAFF